MLHALQFMLGYSTIDANFADYKRLTNGRVRNSVCVQCRVLVNCVCEAFTEHDGKLAGRQPPGALQHLPIFFNIAQGQQYQLGGRFAAREMAAILNDLPKAREALSISDLSKKPAVGVWFFEYDWWKKVPLSTKSWRAKNYRHWQRHASVET